MLRPGIAKAFGYALISTAGLCALIVVGSRRLTHFDSALVAYTFAALFAAFGLTYRYAIWLQRPPTALYWKRGWQVFLRRGHRQRNAGLWVRRLASASAGTMTSKNQAAASLGRLISASKLPANESNDHLFVLEASSSMSPARGSMIARVWGPFVE